MGHNEKYVSSEALILRDQTGKALDTAQIGIIILSGPIAYINTGVTWMPLNS